MLSNPTPWPDPRSCLALSNPLHLDPRSCLFETNNFQKLLQKKPLLARLRRCSDECPPALCELVVGFLQVVFLVEVEGVERVLDQNPELHRSLVDTLSPLEFERCTTPRSHPTSLFPKQKTISRPRRSRALLLDGRPS